MQTVLVNKETLQKLLDYIGPSESDDYEECASSDWSEEQLSNHAYALIIELQETINNA